MKVLIYNWVNMRLKKLTFIVFTIVLGSWPLNAFSQNVDFPDPNLAAAVRSALSLAEGAAIPRTDLDRLIILLAKDAGIRDLTGLENATNLRGLDLSRNEIRDISALSDMTKLTVLGLSRNEIRDISALSDMTELTVLHLSRNEIRDISALSGMTELTVLGLSRNEIRDISALSDMTELTQLYLSNNQIRDISALSGMTELTVLYLTNNQISDLNPLSRLTNITLLLVVDNPITDIRPLSTLLKLEIFIINAEFDKKYPGVLQRVISANTQIHFVYPTNPEFGLPIAREKLTRGIAPRCGLGWAPQSPYTHHLQQPKVVMYALEFEFNQHAYTCSVIEIRTGDATLSDFEGWRLYLGTLYNPSYIPIVLTQANSQITDGVLRLTPEMLGLETFPCNTVGGISHPLPGVHYVLKSDANVLVDTAYSCFVWGQNAYTTVDGINVESPRRISSAALREMEVPRLERYITDPTGIFITYMGIEDFGWDRFVLSDWLLPPNEPSAWGAPSAIQRKIATTWGSLKAPD